MDQERAPAARRGERLDHADQEPHRHALYRHSNSGRHQNLRSRLGQDRGDRQEHLRRSCKSIPGTRSVYAERVTSGYYLDFELKREEIARYGLTIDDIQMIIESAIGGESITTTVEGRERYPVSVRYARELRDDPEKLKRVLIPTMNGAQVPLGQLADASTRFRSGHDPRRRWPTRRLCLRRHGGPGYRQLRRRGAKERLLSRSRSRSAIRLSWSGQYEYMQRAKEKLMYVVPLTLLIIFVLLYINLRSAAKCGIVLLAIPFSMIGAIWFVYLLGYNMSVAVWVGIIALAGVDAETGVIMLLYLDQAYEKWRKDGTHANDRRSPRGDHRRRGEAHSAEDDDGDGDPGWFAADHVEPRRRRRRDEADRRADDRRRYQLVSP